MPKEPLTVHAYCYVLNYPDGSPRLCLSTISRDDMHSRQMALALFPDATLDDVVRVEVREVVE